MYMYLYNFIQNGAVCGVWLGVTGLSPLLLVYPSPDLDWLWNTSVSDSPPPDLASVLSSASLTLDPQGNLIAVRCIHSIHVHVYT